MCPAGLLGGSALGAPGPRRALGCQRTSRGGVSSSEHVSRTLSLTLGARGVAPYAVTLSARVGSVLRHPVALCEEPRLLSAGATPSGCLSALVGSVRRHFVVGVSSLIGFLSKADRH